MFLIADIGINHNGSLETAFKLIDQAKETGFNVVKFQKRTPRLCISKEKWDKEKISCFGKTTYIEYKELIEFDKLQYNAIDKYCKEKDIQWTASVWDIPSLNFLLTYEIPFIKIPSEKLTDDELIQACITTNKPIIMSLGLSTLKDIEHALAFFPQNYDLKLMYCNSIYPCPLEQTHLSMINYLQNIFPNFTIGFSSHEEGLTATFMAIDSGVELIERHITLDKQNIGTDHKCSLDLKDMYSLKDHIKLKKNIYGVSKKYLEDIQNYTYKKYKIQNSNYVSHNNTTDIYYTYYLDNIYTILTHEEFQYRWLTCEEITPNNRDWIDSDYYLKKYKNDKTLLAKDILINGTFSPFFGIKKQYNNEIKFEITSGGHRIESLQLLNSQEKINRKFLFIYWDLTNQRLYNPIQLYHISAPLNKVYLRTLYTYEEVFLLMDELFGWIQHIFRQGKAFPSQIFNDEIAFNLFLKERVFI